MDGMFRISVRELVAFSCFPPDIMPAADTEAMLEGARAHKARQAEADGLAEQSIKQLYEVEGASILVFGRMDLLSDGDVPLIEEIKHSFIIPEQVRDEHRAQALCYAAMLSRQRNGQTIRFAVTYVNLEGAILCRFEEELSGEQLETEMHRLLLPYARFAIREEKHRLRRNESLTNLPFPFASYRKGQRELAVQVYTAISRKKRLFASLPTGTGKSAAVLYPALKALAEEKTERLVYLTARNTARQSPLHALRRMQQQGMTARCCILTAKEKVCPHPVRCHPDDCPRAKGHFLRQGDAIDTLLASGEMIWDENVIRRWADRFELCPFEFSLALSELADVLMMDLNYAFDPFAQIKRLFQRQKHFTLLVDEAHHVVERVRENHSGALDSRELVRLRTEYGKQSGRKTQVYQALSGLIRILRQLPAEEDECILNQEPELIAEGVQQVLDASIQTSPSSLTTELIRICLPYLYAHEHLDDDYAILQEKHGKERMLMLYCLLPGKEITRITKGLHGAVFFSATLHPLQSMKQLLGGTEEDACFSLPSPFPPQNLAVIRKRIQTRYTQRERTAQEIACAIRELWTVNPGNTIVFFPSYAYMGLVLKELDAEADHLWIQTPDMDEADRAAFLTAFETAAHPLLGMCVLGGLFSEGIDLPGEALVNAVIVGVGLPVPSIRLNAVRSCYHEHFGDGFGYACRIPGMQKVLQAAGRVIRSEKDRGMILLLDERYYEREYELLLPGEWRIDNENISRAAADWRKMNENEEKTGGASGVADVLDVSGRSPG